VNYHVIITPLARIDIAEAVQWYEKRSAGLGRIFWREVKARLIALKQNPLLPPAYGRRNFRKLRIPKFPYSAYYEIVGEEIRVHAVFHAARNPRTLKMRLQ
jgi:plasmid stabilization system protein ParE